LPERQGDTRHSLADLSRSKKELKFSPQVLIHSGLSRLIGKVNKKYR